MRIAALHRYPVKGLSAEPIDRVALTPGAYWPDDRLFAVENGPSGFDPAAPEHQPKIKFLMLMKHEALARLETRYDAATGLLTVKEGCRELLSADLGAAAGLSALAEFLTGWLPREAIRGPLRVLRAPEGFRFTDSKKGFVSLLNLASVAALEERLGTPVDPLRFRANLHLEGLPAWAEFDLVGQVLESPSGARLKVTARIDRCAATGVEPGTGLRDLAVVRTLMEAYGHIDCGVYAEIIAPGTLQVGQRLAPAPTPPPRDLAF
jgi:hypothetical protein